MTPGPSSGSRPESWLREYDKEYSAKHKFPASIKLTTVKPSGTLSLLAGVTPGVHPNPAGPYYIRRVRISSQSPLVDVCRQHGYHIEYQRKFDGSEDKSTMVISFPCNAEGVVANWLEVNGERGATLDEYLPKLLQSNKVNLYD